MLCIYCERAVDRLAHLVNAEDLRVIRIIRLSQDKTVRFYLGGVDAFHRIRHGELITAIPLLGDRAGYTIRKRADAVVGWHRALCHCLKQNRNHFKILSKK